MANEPPFGHALLLVWEEYRKSAKRSRELKDRLNRTRAIVLCLVVLGSVLGLLADQSSDWLANSVRFDWLPQAFALVSAVSLALAAFFSKEILDSKTEREWISSRSQAEALKSEAYKYMAKASPYEGADADKQLSDQAKIFLSDTESLKPVDLTESEKRANLPEDWLSVDAYIRERVEQQINGYYRPRASEHHRMLGRLRLTGLVLGGIGAVLGAIGASGIGVAWAAGWIAVIGAVSGSVAAFGFAGRYQYLAMSYELTSRRLNWLIHDWNLTPKAERLQKASQFVIDCENAISVENHNWVAEWTEKAKSS